MLHYILVYYIVKQGLKLDLLEYGNPTEHQRGREKIDQRRRGDMHPCPPSGYAPACPTTLPGSEIRQEKSTSISSSGSSRLRRGWPNNTDKCGVLTGRSDGGRW